MNIKELQQRQKEHKNLTEVDLHAVRHGLLSIKESDLKGFFELLRQSKLKQAAVADDETKQSALLKESKLLSQLEMQFLAFRAEEKA